MLIKWKFTARNYAEPVPFGVVDTPITVARTLAVLF